MRVAGLDPPATKVVFVPFKDDRPEGWYENFVTGFWVSGRDRAEVWGGPAALAVAKDGALLVATIPAARLARCVEAALTPSPRPRRASRHGYATFSSFCKVRSGSGIGVSGKLVFQLVTPTSPT